MRMRQSGYTLIELLVAITIGGVVLAAVMGSFLALSKTQKQLDLTRQIQREINFATIRMADRVRSQSIDYDLIDAAPENHHFLPIKDDEVFVFNEDEHQLTMNDAPLFSKNLMVRELEFKVSKNPDTSHVQPWVRIELLVSDRTTDEELPKVSIPLRTTISSRMIQ